MTEDCTTLQCHLLDHLHALLRGGDGRMHPEAACLEPDHRHAHGGVDAEVLQSLGLLKGPDGVLDGLQQPKCQKDCTGMHGAPLVVSGDKCLQQPFEVEEGLCWHAWGLHALHPS